MGRIPRKNKEGMYSKEYLEHIQLSDFLGKLTDSEIEIAKLHGLLRWDIWKKAGRAVVLTAAQHHKGIRLAPILDGHGKPDPAKHTTRTKFLIKNYEELERYTKD